MNKLRGSRCYLAGPIDRADDFTTWRNELKLPLRDMGIVTIDPCDKPILGYSETPEFILEKREWKRRGQFDKILEFRSIRNEDLRLCDASDMCIVRLDMNSRPFGTIEEICEFNRSKKPIMVWLPNGYESCPDWLLWMLGGIEHVFDNKDSMLAYLRDIDNGAAQHKRFVFFDHNKLI